MKINNCFVAVILAYFFVINANAYDFYVETSDFGGGVSIIEDVVSLNSPEINNDVQSSKKINDTEVLMKSSFNEKISEDRRQGVNLLYNILLISLMDNNFIIFKYKTYIKG